jgi:hypothetical protein
MLERPMDAARRLRAATLAGTGRGIVAAAGAAVHRLLVRPVAMVPRPSQSAFDACFPEPAKSSANHVVADCMPIIPCC